MERDLFLLLTGKYEPFTLHFSVYRGEFLLFRGTQREVDRFLSTFSPEFRSTVEVRSE